MPNWQSWVAPSKGCPLCDRTDPCLNFLLDLRKGQNTALTLRSIDIDSDRCRMCVWLVSVYFAARCYKWPPSHTHTLARPIHPVSSGAKVQVELINRPPVRMVQLRFCSSPCDRDFLHTDRAHPPSQPGQPERTTQGVNVVDVFINHFLAALCAIYSLMNIAANDLTACRCSIDSKKWGGGQGRDGASVGCKK